jgi:hypothetical protein
MRTAGQKAAYTRKWRSAAIKAHRVAQNAKTFTKYELGKRGYRCISLDSRRGYEYKGVVDLVAVKRSTRKPDQLEVMLVQVKGGGTKVSNEELKRLRQARGNLKVTWNVAEKPRRTVQFRRKVL